MMPLYLSLLLFICSAYGQMSPDAHLDRHGPPMEGAETNPDLHEVPLIRCGRPVCDMVCAYGMALGEDGCQICQCLTPDDLCKMHVCVEGQRCRVPTCMGESCLLARPMCITECPLVRCQVCESGIHLKDENGCQTCQCGIPLIQECPMVKCQVCESGIYLRDENDCQTCQCGIPLIQECPMADCITCESGIYLKDDNGCQTCECGGTGPAHRRYHGCWGYIRHRPMMMMVIIPTIISVIIILIIITVCLCKRRKMTASYQFKHKKMENMENFQKNLILSSEWEKPELVCKDEVKVNLADDPIEKKVIV